MWVCEDRVIGRSGHAGASAAQKQLSAIGRAGIDDDGYRAGTPKLRLEDMDRDGLCGVGDLRTARRSASRSTIPTLQDACFAAWNDWAVEEFNAVAPDRLCVLAFLPGHSPEAAAAELERCAALGHRGAIIGVFDIDVGDPAWDRLWAAAEETGLPISFHIKGGTSSKLSYQIGKWQSAAFATLLPLQLDEPLATMVFCGALERHPRPHARARGVGHRLAAVLPRAHGRRVAARCGDKLDYAPSIPPSELFRRQVMRDVRGGRARPRSSSRSSAPTRACGRPTIRTPTARSPTRAHAIEETLGTLPAADRRKITATNCARLYGFADA